MKFAPLFRPLLACCFVLAASAAQSQTHIINVSAVLTPQCVVNTATSTLAFGTLTGAAPTATWSGGTVACTLGTAFTVTSNDGLNETGAGGALNRMRRAGVADCSVATDCMRYTLVHAPAGVGLGLGTPISFGVTGSTTVADYTGVSPGSYSDTVTLTVAP